jgi:hypothetical protein
LQTIFRSSVVTGFTERREYFPSATAASFLSALIAAIVTGVGSGLSGLDVDVDEFVGLVGRVGIGSRSLPR